ncbi:hypothetical protein G8E10_18815 [Rhizobiaceae bacterium CRRU44]|uniref:Uncharacterized protein n=1 Tax=Ferranicluibacter rubi TaxID=2715133 RepID=A0AA43ZH28_9HYPH|nr:hypothetical protein [Ferranicluibacter rubi]NHT77758.1 hypothetical protein [Ferranicluibacter rubi]
MSENETAACRRFPDRSTAIRGLSARDDGFRDMCADLATAEAELQRWQASDDPGRSGRVHEYRVLVDELTLEIAAALDASAIVPFHRR